MKRRVAVVSSCCPPLPGRPATGGGLRTAQLVQTLTSAGHSVVLFVERDALPEDPPAGIRPFQADTLQAALKAARPSVIVVEQWALVAALGTVDKPLVLDLHGSLLLENVYRRGEPDLVLDAGAKLQALHRADLLLCPAPVQLHHFASWATLAGFDPRELPLALLPLALPGTPTGRKAKSPPLRLVYGGARWPWIDSLDSLQATVDAVEALDGASLDVFTYEPPRHGLPLEEDLGTWADVDEVLAGRERVTHHDGVGQDAYAAFLRAEATVALDLWAPNPERLLAATTRSGEFLHAGLPVITVAGSAWAEELVASGAGWALPPNDPGALSALLSELSKTPAKIAAASRAATALMAESHSLDTAGRTLVEFVAAPHRPPRSPATLVDSIVAVRQAHVDEVLRSERLAHEDEHTRLVAGHREEVSQLRAAHRGEVDELSARHAAVADQLRDAHRADVDRLSTERRDAVEAQGARHDQEIDALGQAHQLQVRALSEEHRAAMDAAVAAHREQAEALAASYREQMDVATTERRAEVLRMAEEAQQAASEAQARHRAELADAVAERKAEAIRLSDEAQQAAAEAQTRHRAELAESVAERKAEVIALATQAQQDREEAEARHHAELTEAAAERKAEVLLIVARAQQDRNEAEARHREELTDAVARHRLAEDDARTAVGRSAGELETAVEEHRAQMAAASAEHRAEMEANAGRHRLEVEGLVIAWQARLDTATERGRSDRHQAREARTRLEVELRAEIARAQGRLSEAHEALSSAQEDRSAARAELEQTRAELAESRATFAAKLRERLGHLDALPGRTRPALHLAKLWVEHALDRSTRGPGPGEG